MIKVNQQLNSGLQTGRRWEDIVDALVKSGCVYLHEGEKITEIAIRPDYGLMLKIEKE